MKKLGKIEGLDRIHRSALLHEHPERSVSTGLNWGERSDLFLISQGLMQMLESLLAEQQRCREPERRKWLQHKLARVEARLAVVERRIGGRTSWFGLDQLTACRIYLEKMADGLNEGAAAWAEAGQNNGSIPHAGIWLGNAVGLASMFRHHGGGALFKNGPFGGLSEIAALVTAGNVQIEMEDLPALSTLVFEAREVGVEQRVSIENEACAVFYGALKLLRGKLQDRDQN